MPKEKDFYRSLKDKTLTIDALKECLKIWRKHHKVLRSPIGRLLGNHLPPILQTMQDIIKASASNVLSELDQDSLVTSLQGHYDDNLIAEDGTLNRIVSAVVSTSTIKNATFKYHVITPSELAYLIAISEKEQLTYFDLRTCNELCRKSSLGNKKTEYLEELNNLSRATIFNQPHIIISDEDYEILRQIIQANINHSNRNLKAVFEHLGQSVQDSNVLSMDDVASSDRSETFDSDQSTCSTESDSSEVVTRIFFSDADRLDHLISEFKDIEDNEEWFCFSRSTRSRGLSETEECKSLLLSNIDNLFRVLPASQTKKIAAKHDFHLNQHQHQHHHQHTSMDALLSPRVRDNRYNYWYGSRAAADDAVMESSVPKDFTLRSMSAR